MGWNGVWRWGGVTGVMKRRSSENKYAEIMDIEIVGGYRSRIISRFDISASAIGFDLNTRLLRP